MYRPLDDTQPPFDVFDLKFLIRVVHIAYDVFRSGVEDLAFPEGDGGEDEEDAPGGAHEDGHDEVPDVEALDVEGISDFGGGKDPTDYRILVRGKISRMRGCFSLPLGKVNAQPRRTVACQLIAPHSRMEGNSQPRISFRLL